jgi:hypothetical protein
MARKLSQEAKYERKTKQQKHRETMTRKLSQEMEDEIEIIIRLSYLRPHKNFILT